LEERIQQTGNERQRNVTGDVERVPGYVFGQQPTLAESRSAEQSFETEIAGGKS